METSTTCMDCRVGGEPHAAEPKARSPIPAREAEILDAAAAAGPACLPKTDRAEDTPIRWGVLAQMLTEEVQHCDRLTWLSKAQRQGLQHIYLLAALAKLDEHNAPLAWIQGVIAMAQHVGCAPVEIDARLSTTTREELAAATCGTALRRLAGTV